MDKKFLLVISGIVLLLIALFLTFRLIAVSSHNRGVTTIKTDDTVQVSDKAQRFTVKDGDETIKTLEEAIAKGGDSPQAESAYFTLASIYEKRQDLVKAKEYYQKIIDKFPDSKDILKCQDALDNVNVKTLFSSIITPDSFVYEVQKGDTLSKIAKKFNTTIELISKSNAIKNNTIQIGKKLKITKARFSMVVDKSQNILTLKSDGNILKTYRVSTGQNFSTPTGNFKVTNKIVDPVWYTAGTVVPAGSPNNILGTRWLGISKPRYGIHGTTDPKSIGKQVTAGCVRMANPDVEELYSIVPEGTEVLIVD